MHNGRTQRQGKSAPPAPHHLLAYIGPQPQPASSRETQGSAARPTSGRAARGILGNRSDRLRSARSTSFERCTPVPGLAGNDRLNGILRFSSISRYLHIHRWQDAKHAPVEHGPIKHAPDLPVYGVANFAFVDHCHRLGCKQSPAIRAARFGARRRISCPPAW